MKGKCPMTLGRIIIVGNRLQPRKITVLYQKKKAKKNRRMANRKLQMRMQQRRVNASAQTTQRNLMEERQRGTQEKKKHQE